MGYDFAKRGQVLHGYHPNVSLGFQEIKPLLLDALAEELKAYTMSWVYTKFVEANSEMIPHDPGIYIFVVHPKAANVECHSLILYVGKANDLQVRFRNYVRERYEGDNKAREKVKKMLTIYKNRIFFGHCTLGKYEIQKVEDLMLKAFAPCCNTVGVRSEPAFPELKSEEENNA